VNRRLIVLAIALAALGCHDDRPRLVIVLPTYFCQPCDGEGIEIDLSITPPVGSAVIEKWHLCFADASEKTCWYDCPKRIAWPDESVWDAGEVCE